MTKDPFAVQEFENAYVTNNAVIIKNGQVVEDSCVGAEYYAKYRKPKFKLKYFFTIPVFTKKRHILISDEWSKNYCHWMWEALSKLILMQEKYPNHTLILPSSYRKINFIMTSLEAFKISKKQIRFIPKKSKLKIPSLSFVSCINIGTKGYYQFLKFHQVRDKLITNFAQKLTTNFGQKIYISRSKPQKDIMRKVTNEQDLTQMLEKYGFKTVYMEDFSFIEQLSIAHNAKFIIAPHGAGITNAMFMPNNSTLIEMVSKDWGGETCFGKMSENIAINYHKFECQQTSQDKTAWQSDIVVDIPLLEKKLSTIL